MLLATLAFSTAVEAPTPRTLTFDSMHVRQAVDGIAPAGLTPEQAGTVLLGDAAIEGRHGIGACFGGLSRDSQLVVSFDPLCGVCGDGRLKYSWTAASSKDYEIQERLVASCRTDVLVVAADPAFEKAASEQGAFRDALRSYFDALAADGITARWASLSSARSQEAMSFAAGDTAGALKRVVAVSAPAMVLLVGEFPAGPEKLAQVSNPRVVFSKLPLSVDGSVSYLARAAEARKAPMSNAKPVVVEFCGGDAACKATANALAGLSGSKCPSTFCLSSPPAESFNAFASKLTAGSRMFLVSAPDSIANGNFKNTILYADAAFPATIALENGALAVVAPSGLGFDWWKQGTGDTVESAGFSGVGAAMVFSAAGKSTSESVQMAAQTTALYANPAGSVHVGNSVLRPEESTLSRQLASEIEFFGDPTIGLTDAAAVARLRGN
jgi:hypothetical protein